MERGEIDEDDPTRSDQPKTMEEHLDDLCMYYMSMGVPYDEFWYGDYCSLKYYEAVYMRQRKVRNEEFWMQGIYHYDGVAIALSNAFRDKGHKAEDYLKEPLPFFPKTEAEEEAEKQKLLRKIKHNLDQFKEAWDASERSKNSKSGDRDQR